MADKMPDGGFGHAGVQETQPPGQVPTGSHFLAPTITPGSTRPCRYVITLTPGDELKVLLVGDIFMLGSTNNDSPRVVSDADNNLCAHCGLPTSQ